MIGNADSAITEVTEANEEDEEEKKQSLVVNQYRESVADTKDVTLVIRTMNEIQ